MGLWAAPCIRGVVPHLMGASETLGFGVISYCEWSTILNSVEVLYNYTATLDMIYD